MKKTSILAAVIVLGSLTGVAQASPVVENTNQHQVVSDQSVEKLPIKLFVGTPIFFEGNDVKPASGYGTVYDIIPAENGFYVKGLAVGTGYISIDGVKRKVEVAYLHPGPDFSNVEK
ncbi:hypothetical protein [Priestia taiwanensis]|uniref:Uncharacterized protein n=1 Tax=Priestia taiwanensis TaxID=1347902 RepID=A0A917ANW8_9BACI|nr:hypothetical protein [Priestia taiwanensis]MBM7362492.1 hypothetical protein [Priestia taiwanensis]GGE62652.1 hypothetical protein GCM10007140_11160 [Priestia taiwanensis]